MSRSAVLDAERSLPCPRCHVGPGQPCVTRTGHRRSWAHSERWQAAKDAGLLPVPRVVP